MTFLDKVSVCLVCLPFSLPHSLPLALPLSRLLAHPISLAVCLALYAASTCLNLLFQGSPVFKTVSAWGHKGSAAGYSLKLKIIVVLYTMLQLFLILKSL